MGFSVLWFWLFSSWYFLLRFFDFGVYCGLLFVLSGGVPQGSCMGPISFILYISRPYHVIANHGYADDAQLA